jgi:hypothetical protein
MRLSAAAAVPAERRQRDQGRDAGRPGCRQGIRQERAGNLPCLEKERDEATGALDNMDPEFTAKKGSIEAIHAKKHNAALDELQVFVDRWNAEKKAFSAKSGK